MVGLTNKRYIDRPAVALLVGLPLLAGLILGANQTRAGAFMPWLGSIAYWVTISFATWWLIAGATRAVDVILRPWQPPQALVWLFGAVVGSIFARPTIYLVTDLFRPLMSDPVLRAMRPWTFDLSFFGHYLTNWSLIILMWLLASAASAEWRKRVEAKPHADEAPLPASDLHGVLLRLPAAIGHDVIALQAEDHYVRVHTRHGNALVLGSLSEAAADLERSGIEGQRTHRSWWVANGAVTAQHKRGRQLYLQLVNGIEAPVSVTYRQLATRSIAVVETAA